MTLTKSIQFLMAYLTMLFSIIGCSASNEAKYPVKDSGLVVNEALSNEQNYYYWLDNHRIITQTRGNIVEDPTISQYKKVGLVVWDVDTNQVNTLIDIEKADGSSLCANDSVVRFNRSLWVDNHYNTISYLGEFDANKKVGNFKINDYVGELNIFTCQVKSETPLPEWAKSIPKANIKLLRPEHGFIVFDREVNRWGLPISSQDNPSDMPRGVRLYHPNDEEKQGVDISKILSPSTYGKFNRGFYLLPKYYAFKNAYYLEYVGGAWWLNPDGTLQQDKDLVKQKNMKVFKRASTSLLYPTKKLSPVAAVNAFNNLEGIRDGGLYTFNSFQNPERLVKGRIGNGMQISPDGCSVAFLNDDRAYIDPRQPMLFHKLQVIHLCTESK